MKNKSIHKEAIKWKGTVFQTEFFNKTDFSDIKPITQVQAVSFIDKSHIVLSKHIDGYFGLPGGHIEKGEDIEKALRRELEEEISADVIDFGSIGYIKLTKDIDLNFIEYQLRFWAKVKLGKETPDPDNKAMERKILLIKEAIQELNWGRRGKLLIKLAQKGYLSKYKS